MIQHTLTQLRIFRVSVLTMYSSRHPQTLRSLPHEVGSLRVPNGKVKHDLSRVHMDQFQFNHKHWCELWQRHWESPIISTLVVKRTTYGPCPRLNTVYTVRLRSSRRSLIFDRHMLQGEKENADTLNRWAWGAVKC